MVVQAVTLAVQVEQQIQLTLANQAETILDQVIRMMINLERLMTQLNQVRMTRLIIRVVLFLTRPMVRPTVRLMVKLMTRLRLKILIT